MEIFLDQAKKFQKTVEPIVIESIVPTHMDLLQAAKATVLTHNSACDAADDEALLDVMRPQS